MSKVRKFNFFTKNFWTKRRVVLFAGLAGLAIAAVATAVPVALLTQKQTAAAGVHGSSGDASKENETPVGEPSLAVPGDKSVTSQYVLDVTYGTTAEELEKTAPRQNGYGAAKLVAEGTNYTPSVDAGTQGITAAFEYASLTNDTKLHLTLPLEIQKAPLSEQEIIKAESGITWSGPTRSFNDYDLSKVSAPPGRTLELQKVNYSLPGIGAPIAALEDVVRMSSGTVIAANYVSKPDKNHYGRDGLLQVNYKYEQESEEPGVKEIDTLIYPPKRIKPDDIPDGFPTYSYAGYNSTPFAFYFEKLENGIFKELVPFDPLERDVYSKPVKQLPPGTVYYLVQTYEKIHEVPGSYSKAFKVYTPFFVLPNDDTTQSYKIHVNIPFGKKVTIYKPGPALGNYQNWSEPSFQLTKPIGPTEDNYDANYSVAKSLTSEELTKVPANSAYTATMVSKSQSNSSQTEYSIEFIVAPAHLKLPVRVINEAYETGFGQMISPPATLSPDPRLGPKSKFDFTNVIWRVGVEGEGEIGPFVKGYEFKDARQTSSLPPKTVVYATLTAKPAWSNLDDTSTEQVVIGMKVSNGIAENKKLLIIYDEDASRLAVPAQTAPWKNGVLQPELSTYKKGLVPGQISTVVFKHADAAGAQVIYRGYIVDIKPREVSDWVDGEQGTPRTFLAGSFAPIEEKEDLDLPEEWTLSAKAPIYYIGEKTEEKYQIQPAQIPLLTKGYVFSATYPIAPNEPRYALKKGKGPFFRTIRYAVSVPHSSLIQFLEQRIIYEGSKDASGWIDPQVPAVAEGWKHAVTHYNFLRKDSPTVPFSAKYEDQPLKDKLQNESGEYILEAIWQFEDGIGRTMLVVRPFKSAEGELAYYSNPTELSGALNLQYGTKHKFFGSIIDISAVRGNDLQSEPAKPTWDLEENTYTSTLPAGTSVILTITKGSGVEVSFIRGIDAQYVFVETRIGRNKVEARTDSWNPSPSQKPAKLSDSENFGEKTYDYLYAEIIGQTNRRSGIYNVGKRLSLQTQLPLLPAGTTVRVIWSAPPPDGNYLVARKQLLIDTYTLT